MNEMVTYLPISSPFIRFAGRYVDEAFGVAAGYNFFVFGVSLYLNTPEAISKSPIPKATKANTDLLQM